MAKKKLTNQQLQNDEMFLGTKKTVTAKESQSLTSCQHQQGSSGISLKRYNAT